MPRRRVKRSLSSMTPESALSGIILTINELKRSSPEKLRVFTIGSTRKAVKEALYFPPVKEFKEAIVAGAVVYERGIAIRVAKKVDGRVDLILVDAEDKRAKSGDEGLEPAIRRAIHKTEVISYKANDLTGEAVDFLVGQVMGCLYGKRVAIIGAGNLGSKAALKLAERGARVTIVRRNRTKLAAIVKALNFITPPGTPYPIVGTVDSLGASRGADLLIGFTPLPAVTAEMILATNRGALIIDGGKGSLMAEAIAVAVDTGRLVLRADVKAGFEGYVTSILRTRDQVTKRMGHGAIDGIPIVAGGAMGRRGEIVVDDVRRPRIAAGVADGTGDFIRSPNAEDLFRLKKVEERCRKNRRR